MKKPANMFVKNLRYLCLVGVIAIGLMTVVGTGGGGGGGGETPPTGTTPTDSLLNKTELLKGYWYFYYTIISTWDDYYTLDTITGDTNSQGGYFIYGIDKYGDPVIAAYWPDNGNWSLLDSGSIIDKYYTFYTDGNTILANSCYYQINISTGDWSPCFTLNGYKVYSLAIQPKGSVTEAIEVEEMKAAEAEEMRVVEGEEAIVDDSIEEKYRQMKQVIDSQK